MDERLRRITLGAEEVLAKIEMDDMAAPLVEVFKAEVVPESIQVYGAGVIGEAKDPDTEMILKLGGGRDSGTLEFYFGTMAVTGQRPLSVPDASVHVYLNQARFGWIQSALHLHRDFDLSFPSTKGLLRILQEVSSRYVALNGLRIKQ